MNQVQDGSLCYTIADIVRLLGCCPKKAREIVTTQMPYRQDNGDNGKIAVPKSIFRQWYGSSFKNADLLESVSTRKVEQNTSHL